MTANAPDSLRPLGDLYRAATSVPALAVRIGQAYNFGSGMGCAALLLAGAALMLLNAGLTALLSPALGSLLSGLAPPA